MSIIATIDTFNLGSGYHADEKTRLRLLAAAGDSKVAPFASLDVAEQFLRVEFPNWFVYRGGSHVALHRVSGGARVLFVRDIAPADPLPSTNSTRHDRRAGTCTRCGKDFTECYSSASCDANLKAASTPDFTVENPGGCSCSRGGSRAFCDDHDDSGATPGYPERPATIEARPESDALVCAGCPGPTLCSQCQRDEDDFAFNSGFEADDY